MYHPVQGRFLSRDPLSTRGIVILYEHPYKYTRNNPANRTDPSGLLCQIAVHCYQATSGSRESPFGGTHCGLTVTDDTHTFWVDGQWRNGLTIRYDRTPQPGFTGFVQGPQTDFDDSVCDCLRTYKDKFNGAGLSYHAGCGNSNWALRCMTEACSIVIPWAVGQAPIGFNCSECVKWRGEMHGCACDKWEFKKCP